MDIQLPQPKQKGTENLEDCIFRRKSIRSFKDKEIGIEKISQILWSAQGRGIHYRTVPSAGATYPLEIYVVLKKKGIFHYNLKNHTLIRKQEGNFNEILANASYRQYFIHKAPLNIVICAEYERTCNRYGERGIRYVFIEVGHCAQNIHLQAVALDLGSVPIGAFNDKKVKRVLNLPDKIEPLYIIPIGYPK